MDVALWLLLLIVVGALVAAIYARGRARASRPSPDKPSAGAEPSSARAPDSSGGEAPTRPKATPGDRPGGPGAEDTGAPEPGDPAPGQPPPNQSAPGRSRTGEPPPGQSPPPGDDDSRS